MRRNLVAIVSIGAAILLAACESEHLPTTSASGLAPRHSPSASRALSCNFSTLPTLARGYFRVPPNILSEPVFGLINQMTSASDAATRASKGFDILARVAMFRYVSATSGPTPEGGGAFVDAIVACMGFDSIPNTFDPTAALRNGIFEVRGGVAQAGPALAYTGSSDGTKTEVSPRYGVEPRTVSGWPTSTGSGAPRYLIYGYPTTGDYAGETPTDGFNAFEVGSLRADLPKTGLRVGICEHLVVTNPNNASQAVAANILIHDDQMIANESPDFCAPPPPPVQTGSASRSWFTRVAALFRPTLAWAQDPDGISRDFIGGGPSGWSPMSWGKVSGTDMNLTFTQQPSNTDKSVSIPTFIVHVASDAGNAIPNVKVTVSVDKNKGIPAGAVVSGTITVTTNSSGDAIFTNVFVGKAGGYRLHADGSLGGVKTNDATSGLFNVKNK